MTLRKFKLDTKNGRLIVPLAALGSAMLGVGVWAGQQVYADYAGQKAKVQAIQDQNDQRFNARNLQFQQMTDKLDDVRGNVSEIKQDVKELRSYLMPRAAATRP